MVDLGFSQLIMPFAKSLETKVFICSYLSGWSSPDLADTPTRLVAAKQTIKAKHPARKQIAFSAYFQFWAAEEK